jgi:hypothetical protein
MNAPRFTASVFSLLCSVLCLLSSVALAQSNATKPARLRFLFLDESAGHYSLKLDTSFLRVSTNPYEISAPYTPADFEGLSIYKALPDPVSGGLKPVKIASVIPPADTPSALVIITPRPPASPDIAPVYKVEFIDTNPALFPPGSIRLINRSPVSMASQFSDSRVVTAPGETSLVQPTTDSRRRVLFKIAIQVQQDTGWQLIQDSMTVIRAKERMFGILVYSPGGMKHMLTAAELSEFGPPKPGCFWLTFADTP